MAARPGRAVAAVAPLVDHAVAVLVAAVAVFGRGPIPPRQAPHAPAAQVSVPRRQSPTSLPHGREIPSTMPSQSSSAPLQVSPPGGRQRLPLTGTEARDARFDHARLRARAADADARGRGRPVVARARLASAADAAVVDDAVAVVIELVAGLRLGQAPAAAGAPVAADAARAGEAGLRAVDADADLAGRGRPS